MSEVSREQEPLTMSTEREAKYRSYMDWHIAVDLLAEIDALRAELQKTKDALAAIGMWDLEQRLVQSEEVIAGMRENASAIAVRLGVDCEGMDDAATWHASVEAIEKSEKVAEKLAEAIGPLFSMAMDSFPKRPHEGACGPESSCDASCMDAAHCSDILRQSKKALALYAAHKKDTQPGGGKSNG